MNVEQVGHLVTIHHLGDPRGVDVVPHSDQGTCSPAVRTTAGDLDLSLAVDRVVDDSGTAGEDLPAGCVVHVAAGQAAHAFAMPEALHAERALLVVAFVDDGSRGLWHCN